MKPHNNSFESKFNPHPHYLKQGQQHCAPYTARMANLSGSMCVACGKVLNVADMHRKGPHSKVELGLCGGCAHYVIGYRRMAADEMEPSLDEIGDDDIGSALQEAGFGNTFNTYQE